MCVCVCVQIGVYVDVTFTRDILVSHATGGVGAGMSAASQSITGAFYFYFISKLSYSQ